MLRNGIASPKGLWALTGLVFALLAPAGANAQRPGADSNVIEGSYIVVYESSVSDVAAATDKREREVGFKSKFRYKRAFEGFSAKLSPGQVKKLRNDPGVAFVSENRRVEASAVKPLAPGDFAPTGVRRVLAGTATTAREASGTSVAVIDTGIKLLLPSRPERGGREGLRLSRRAPRPMTGTATAHTLRAQSPRRTTSRVSSVSRQARRRMQSGSSTTLAAAHGPQSLAVSNG